MKSFDILSLIILSSSVALQIAAAALALLSLPHSRRYKYPWILLSLALLLMVERRAVPLYDLLRGRPPDFLMELVGLVISVFMAVSMVGLRRLLLALREKEEKLVRLAVTDNLTGIDNRSQALDKLRAEVIRSGRSGEPLSVLILDIDFFKKVNDEYGHITGDDVLVATTSRCAGQLRAIDVFGRLGGEEFLIVLPGTSIDEAYRVAERIRSVFVGAPLETPGGPFAITVSIGLTAYNPPAGGKEKTSADALVKSLLLHADLALYQAKHEGRNCVRVWKDTKDRGQYRQ